MSAAEKLERLDATIKRVFAEEPFDEDWTAELLNEYMDAMLAVRKALPQIVAVVEAAEFSADVYRSTPIALVKALAALEEVLT